LLKFINAINKLANTESGRIIKLLGNHEIGSIINSDWYSNYVFPQDVSLINYYKDESRKETFNVGKEGFHLLFEDGCGLLIKINNTIFVHGQLPNSPITIKDIIIDNNFINNPNNKLIEEQEWTNILDKYKDDNSMLWKREWSNDQIINNRLDNYKREKNLLDEKIIYPNDKQNEFCRFTILERIKEFMKLSDIIEVQDLRVIVGHCPQSYSTIFEQNNSTFNKKDESYNDYSSKKYDQSSIYTGLPKFNDQDKIFGITMQCPKKNNDNYVFHVDIGSSRIFDQNYVNIRNRDSENQILFSKTPQVLKIDSNDKIFIIKSKMRNTRIHLPRPNYENMIITNNLTDLNLSSSDGYYDN